MKPRSIDRDSVVENYRRLQNIFDVASAMNINEKSVRNILKEMKIQTTPRNLRNRKYEIDEGYFENIDSVNKAYFLGFIWGDGNLVDRKNNHQLRIEISRDDQEVILNLRREIKSTHKITSRTRLRNGTQTDSVMFCITRKKIVSDLINLGLTQNKNESLSFPQIRTDLEKFFILGLSDSDGSITIDSQNRAVWSIISNTNICETVRRILSNSGIFSRVISTPYKNLSRVILTKKSEIIKLRELLYSNDVLYLSRKKQKIFSVSYRRQEV